MVCQGYSQSSKIFCGQSVQHNYIACTSVATYTTHACTHTVTCTHGHMHTHNTSTQHPPIGQPHVALHRQIQLPDITSNYCRSYVNSWYRLATRVECTISKFYVPYNTPPSLAAIRIHHWHHRS